MELVYEGKAKQLFKTENPNELYVHYKNSATALNGLKKEELEGKGILNNSITSFIFKFLGEKGVRTHFIKQVNETDQICEALTIIPLEVITRNMVAGSMAKKYGIEEGTPLAKPIFEMSYKNDALGDPMLNDDHAVALGIVTEDELTIIKSETAKINALLQEMYLKAGLILVDFKIEFGKTSDGTIILGDEISPDTCRLWDVKTRKKLDKDRFRHDLGNVMDAYKEVWERLQHAWN